jgi:hypothetical protein
LCPRGGGERGGRHALSKGRGVWRWQGCGGGGWLATRCAGAGEEGGPVGVGRSWAIALGRAIENSNFLIYSNGINLIQSKDGPPELKKIQVKYGCEGN